MCSSIFILNPYIFEKKMSALKLVIDPSAQTPAEDVGKYTILSYMCG